MRKFPSSCIPVIIIPRINSVGAGFLLAVALLFSQVIAWAQPEQPIHWAKVVRMGPNEVSIQWTRYPLANFKRYRVIRNEGRIEQYNYQAVIDSIPNQGVTEYSDTKGIRPDVQYHYYIKVIGEKYTVLSTTDKWGDVGRWANLVPAQIVISTVESDGRSVNLQWEQCTSPEFYEYVVFRTQQPDVLKKLANVKTLDQVNALPGRIATLQHKPDATALVDKNLNPNEVYYYFTAVISGDQQAQMSRPVTVRMPPPLPEQLSPVLKCSQDSGAIDLSWSGYRGLDFERYWLVRMFGQVGAPPSRTDTFAIPGVDTVYRDLHVLQGSYTYQVGVKTADHGVVVSNWTSIVIRPKRTGADRIAIWNTGESVKSENGVVYGVHPFFMNDYGNEIYAAGIVLLGEGPAGGLFPYVLYQWRGHDDPHQVSLKDWLKSFNVTAVDEAKLRAWESGLADAVHNDSHAGDDAQFEDSVVRNVMNMSVRDTTGLPVHSTSPVRSNADARGCIERELRNAYPNLMALELSREHTHFIAAVGSAAILGVLLVGFIGMLIMTRKQLGTLKATAPETVAEYAKRSKDAAFLEKLSRQLTAASASMTVSEALKQLLARVETSQGSSATGHGDHPAGKGVAVPPALIQALIHLHQGVEHNFAHYGNYERFSAHQAENVITDYIKIAKIILTLPIEGEKFGHAPSPHDIEKKLNDGTTVLMHVFDEIQHERGVLRKIREDVDVHDAKDVKDVPDKVKGLKRTAASFGAIQMMLERSNLIPHVAPPAGGVSSDEVHKTEEMVLRKLEEVLHEKGAVGQKLAVAFPGDDERTRLQNLIDQVLRVQHQLHIKTIAQLAGEVEGVSKYAEHYMELANEVKRLNPAIAVGDPQAVRAEFKKQLGH